MSRPEINPYASPHGPDGSAAIIRLVCWVMRGGNGPAARDQDTGELILKPGWVPLLVNTLIAVGAPLAISLLVLFAPSRADRVFAPLLTGILASLGGLGVFCCLKHRVSVSADRLRLQLPLRRGQTLPWGQVTEVSCGRSGTLVLISDEQRRVMIPPNLEGVAEFARCLDQFLPMHIRRVSQDEIERFNAFLSRGASEWTASATRHSRR